ncbi:Zinc finger, C2H [Trema orientale]|uniref:RING-type E3 ubiquitin transferase n=1 Tax=Trema orientale TaxID=63057 RepID=A0A2P5EX83_TREOI|nr:Zinc finger, C2H [Trema orientale]
MLQIRLSKTPSADGAGGAKPLPVDTVTVACPDHLVLADLPVAKGIGAAIAASLVKTVGRRSRRQLGERVHFCVRCDFPIAIYGRLSPCEHAFCLDCARSDSICYLCDERIQKIQTIKIMEGIFICAAPHCLKSFLKRTDFESHIHENHAELLQSNVEKEDNNDSEVQCVKQSSVSDSNIRATLRSGLSPGSNSQVQDREDKARRQQTREQSVPRAMIPPKPHQAFGQVQNNQSEPQPDYRPQGFDRPGPHNPFQQQNFDSPGAPKQEPGLYSEKQQGNMSETPFPEYPPMHAIQPPNYMGPVNSNQMLNRSVPFGYPPFPGDGSQAFYGAPYDMARQDSAPEAGSEQGSLLGFPPGSAGNTNLPANYHQPWNAGQVGMPFEHPQGGQDSFTNLSDSQGKVPYYPGEFGRNPGGPPTPMANKVMEPLQDGNPADPRDGKGILAPQPMQLPPPPPPPHTSHMKRKYYSGDIGRDGQSYGWQHENRESFGSGQD